jgi:hypothetical protein
MKRFWAGLIVGVAGAVLLAAFWLRPEPARPPKEARIKEAPSYQEKQRADVSLSAARSGKLTGEAPLPPDPSQTSAAAFPAGTQVTVPVSGTVHTVYRDGRTGAELGDGEHPLTGEATLTFDADRLRTETTFEDTAEIALFLPEHSWRVGLTPYELELAWRKRLWKNLFIGAELERRFDRDWELGVRLEMEF